jgi:hypothetical protein
VAFGCARRALNHPKTAVFRPGSGRPPAAAAAGDQGADDDHGQDVQGLPLLRLRLSDAERCVMGIDRLRSLCKVGLVGRYLIYDDDGGLVFLLRLRLSDAERNCFRILMQQSKAVADQGV